MHPEVGFHETRTAAASGRDCRGNWVAVSGAGWDGRALVAELGEGNRSSPSVPTWTPWPLQEDNQVPYASQIPA